MDIGILQHYAKLGMRLHPLKAQGKTPAIRGWADEATTDLITIGNWDAQFPDANWGMVAGAGSNITVVDIDPRNGGAESWDALTAKYGEPDAPKVSTAGGGWHYYFRYFVGGAILGKGIDVLASRKNVVLPPSTTEQGAYKWLAGAPSKFPLAPKWMRDAAKVKTGTRNEDAYREACTLFRQGSSQADVLAEIMARYGDENDPDHNEGIQKTVTSAYQRVQAPRASFVNYNGNDPADFDNFIASDFGNTQLLAKYVANDVLHVKDVGWVVYRNGRWDFDDSLIYNRFTDIMDNQRKHYQDAANRAPDKNTEKELRAREQHFTISTNNRVIRNSVELAESIPQFATTVQHFDTADTAHLLNFTNGTVDLRTGDLRPHRKEDYITKQCPIAYDHAAAAPFWEETLGKIFEGNAEMIAYVQLMLGASIMGSQDARMLFIAYGSKGQNGKSTIFETLSDVLGDYADNAELKMLAGTDTGNLTELTTRMRIRGARFVFSSEVASSDQIDASVIKRLTGGDSISARSMFKATTTFRPICSIWLRTNKLPAIRGADAAFWNRICIIPFDHIFTSEEKIDMSIVMERLKAEAPGIVAWLIRGAIRWNNRGETYAIPKRVQELRETYMSDTDTLGDFTSDMMVQQPGGMLKLSAVHRAYSDFCKKRGAQIPTLSAFKQELRDSGLLSADGKSVQGYVMNQEYEVFEMSGL